MSSPHVHSPDEFQPRAAVGNGRPCQPGDVLALRAALGSLGRHGPKDREQSCIDRALDSVVRAYQRDRGLKIDGWLAPDGPTARSIRFDLACLGES